MKAKAVVFGVAAALLASGPALGDGMIVPVRPDLRVRGAWSVKYHHVSVTVRDQVASVTIDQEFVNDGRGMIEVEYLFPLPPHAAIDGMTMTVNGKEFSGKIMKAEDARRVYEDIVRRKKDPALLEYAGFGLYRTKAFPLEPGKPCRVVINYKDFCKKDRDLVEVWYPLNTEKFSARPIESVEVTADIKSRADVTAVYSPTHDVHVQRKGPRHVIVKYAAKKVLPTTDFQVFYKASNEAVGATLLTHQPRPGKDGYFLMLVSPNPRVAGEAGVAKDLVIVLDHSGSMAGKMIAQAKGAVRYVLRNLNSEDRFNVIAYSDSAEAFFDGLPERSQQRIEEAIDRLDRIEARGGTNIYEALQLAMAMLGGKPVLELPSHGKPLAGAGDRPKYVIFLTDGQPTVGAKTEEKDILLDTKSANTCGARMFAFGVGYDVNVRLLDRLVADNRGRSDYVKPTEPVETRISSLYAKIKNPVMTELKVTIAGLRLRDMYPREPGDLFDGDQIVLVGRYLGEDVAGLKAAEGAYQTQLVVAGKYRGRQRAFEYPVSVNPSGRDARFAFVEQLWAIRRVGYLLDQIQLHGKSEEVLDELVRLSMVYGIITPYTSFLADETGGLGDVRELRTSAREAASGLRIVDGAGGQIAAMNRQRLNLAVRPAAPSALGKGVVNFGFSDRKSYEAGRLETVANVRNVGNQAMYRRGRLWVTPETAKLDLKADADKIVEIRRFSPEYFELVRRNTVLQNQMLAGQQVNEELLIRLHGQVYLVR